MASPTGKQIVSRRPSQRKSKPENPPAGVAQAAPAKSPPTVSGSRSRGNAKTGQGKKPKDKELMLRIGRRLNIARRTYNPNQTDVAIELGVTSKVLSAAERGRNYPDVQMLVQFCLLTGCTMDWLFLGRMESKIPIKMAAQIGGLAPDLLVSSEREVAPVG
jgi:transcriptional regulator with XRE-family HTH domain